MRVVVTLEQRFYRSADDRVWSVTVADYPFWARYLDVFDHVRVVARVGPVQAPEPNWQRADGPGVSFFDVPYYIGPRQYLQQFAAIRRTLQSAVEPDDAVIMRVSSTLANDLALRLRRVGHPYGVEVVADPYDVFAPGSVRHPLRPFLRWYFPRKLRQQCVRACAAAYVTREALQRRYPPAARSMTTHFSSIDLPAGAFCDTPREFGTGSGPFTLITVGTLAQLYKAPDVLIDAVARCVADGLDLRLVLVGDGQYRPELEDRAAQHGINSRVCFLGQLPGSAAVREQLDQADLFVLPSYQEGLPRAMVEAMARGLPCIGSTVGGIPELLPPEDMVPPGDAVALADTIRAVVENPQRMSAMSARNLARASEYRNDILQARRTAFYRYIRAQTQDWLAHQPFAPQYSAGES
jgi:glycosyltransferase involved in cell wall biosynthesis